MTIQVLVGLILRIFTIIVFAADVLPRMYKEAKLDDRLKFLRLAIPFMTGLFTVIQFLVIWMYYCRLTGCSASAGGLMDWFSMMNSIGSFLIAVTMSLIYRREY